MLKALAAKGGVIQMCFLSMYVRKPAPEPGTGHGPRGVPEEIRGPRGSRGRGDPPTGSTRNTRPSRPEYPAEKATVADLVDHIDHVVKVVGIDYVGIGTDFDGGGGITGCDDVSGMIHVTEELLRRGYSEADIAKIWGGNFMRVFRKAIEVSGKLKSSM